MRNQTTDNHADLINIAINQPLPIEELHKRLDAFDISREGSKRGEVFHFIDDTLQVVTAYRAGKVWYCKY